MTVLSSRSPTKVTPLADNYWRADSLSAFHSVFLPLSVSFVDTPTPRHPVSVGLSLSTPLSLVCCVCCPVDGVCLYELKCCMLLLLLFVVVVVMSLVSADVLFRRFLFVFVLFSRLYFPLSPCPLFPSFSVPPLFPSFSAPTVFSSCFPFFLAT